MTAPLSPYNLIMATPDLGRHGLLQNQAEKLIQVPSYVGMIYAASGLGKTFCADYLVERLKANDTQATHIIRYDGIEADNGLTFLEMIEEAVDKDLRPNAWVGVKTFLSGGIGKNLWAVLSGVVKDFGAKHNMENTMDALTSAVGAPLIDIEAKKANGDRLGERLLSLRDRVNKADKRYFLVIDGVERISDPGLRALTELIRKPVSNIRIMLFVGKGWDAEQQSKQLKELIGRLQSQHFQEIYELHGLSIKEIQDWYRSDRGANLSYEKAEIVFNNSVDGNPSIIKSWLKSNSLNPGDVLQHGASAWGQMRVRLDVLSAKEHTVVDTLACAFPHPIKPEHLIPLCEISASDLNNIIRRLNDMGDLISDSRKGIRCFSRNLADCIKNQIGSTAVNFRQGLLLDAIYGTDGKHKALPQNIMENLSSSLLSANTNDPESIRFVLSTVESSLESGAYQLAEKILSSIESLPENAIENWDIQNKVTHARLRADLVGQYGNYTLAIKWAKTGLLYTTDPKEIAALQLNIGDKYLQIGQYLDASEHFSSVRKNARLAKNDEQYTIALVRSIKALFDIERYKSSIRLAKVANKILSTANLSNKTRCLCGRWIGRAYALEIDLRPNALFQANEALDIAQRLGHIRNIGNCKFALGEVKRQAHEYADAINYYSQSLTHARDSVNRDLEAYSLLGIALVSLKLGEMDQFTKQLDELEISLNFEAPMEKLYLKTFRLIERSYKTGHFEKSDIGELCQELDSKNKKKLAVLISEIPNRKENTVAEKIATTDWNLFIL